MKIFAKDIKWKITEDETKTILPLLNEQEERSHKEFLKYQAEEEKLIAKIAATDGPEAADEYPRDYEDFAEYFDREGTLSSLIECHLGLPSSTVVEVASEDYTENDVRDALSVKYKHECEPQFKYDKARGNEVAKQTIIDAVNEIVDSDDFKSFLNLGENFKNYSTKNKLLVFKQKPNATIVKGMYTWRNDYERFVNKGASAIWIYAPSYVKFNGEKDIDKFVAFAQESRSSSWCPVRITEQDEPAYIARLKAGEKLEFVRGFTVAPVFDVSDTHGKEFDYQKKDTLLDEAKANTVLSEYCTELGITPAATSFDTIKKIAEDLLYGRMIKVPTIAAITNVSAEKKVIEVGAISYIVGRNLGLDTTNHSLGSLAAAFSNDPVGTRAEVFGLLYERIDKTSAYINKCLEKYIAKENEVSRDNEMENDELER